MNESQESNPDVVGSSALDVISCGLGAAVLLFLVLSVVRAQPAKTAGSADFIHVTFTVPAGDAGAVLAPVIEPPGGPKIQLLMQYVDPSTGQYSPGALDAATVEGLALKKAAPLGLHFLGFSLRGELGIQRSERGDRVFKMHIPRPAPGVWNIAARYFNYDSTNGGSSRRNLSVPVEIAAATRHEVISQEAQQIHYAGKGAAVSVTVRP